MARILLNFLPIMILIIFGSQSDAFNVASSSCPKKWATYSSSQSERSAVQTFRATSRRTTSRQTTAIFGIFDAFKGAFSNAEYSAPPEGVKASASHILVPTEDIALDVKKRVETGELTFAQAAGKFSTCNSKSQGGSLGSFPPGRMVREFDDVIFNPSTELNAILGPVTTKFGVHLIVIGKRSGV